MADQARGFWIDGCRAFLVDDETNQPVGVVDDIVTHPVAGSALLVAAPRGGRLIVPVKDVIAIDPGERRLSVVRGPDWIVQRRPRPSLLRRLARRS